LLLNKITVYMPSKIIIYIIVAAVVTALIGIVVYFMLFTDANRFVGEKSEPESRAVLPKQVPTKGEPELPITSVPVSEVPTTTESVTATPAQKPKVLPPPVEPAPEIVPEKTKPRLHTVSVRDNHFDPRVVTITVGDTVLWINNGVKLYWPSADPHPTHSALPEFDPLADLSPGESYTFTFTQVGAVPYHDHTQAIIDDVATITGTVIVLAPK